MVQDLTPKPALGIGRTVQTATPEVRRLRMAGAGVGSGLELGIAECSPPGHEQRDDPGEG